VFLLPEAEGDADLDGIGRRRCRDRREVKGRIEHDRIEPRCPPNSRPPTPVSYHLVELMPLEIRVTVFAVAREHM